jgi:hypothetical protein
MKKLKMIALKYRATTDADDKTEVHLENTCFYYCRINLSKQYLVDELIQEFGDHEIYKYVLYP